MLTCPNCGSDNRYGAIFCRGCGRKLEIIHELTVDTLEEKTMGKRRRRKKEGSELRPEELRKRGIVKNAIRIAVILLVGFAVYLTQTSPPVSAIPTSESSRGRFVEKKNQLEAAIKDRSSRSVTISEKELNSYVAGLVPNVRGGKGVKVENVQVALGGGKNEDKIAIRMHVRVFGKRMLFQLFGTLKGGKGGVKFSPGVFAKIGKLPYPAFLMKWHCRNLLGDMKADTDLLKKVTQAKVKRAKVTGRGTTPAVEVKVGGKS